MDSKFGLARRRFCAFAVACAAPIVSLSAAEAAGRKKYAKERVGYRDEPYQGRTCATCVLYVGHGECAIVEGAISPQGWCTQWTPATMGGASSIMRG
ncbi:MAG TPA: high-potential iron-sulfur protein [Burkholderiales bacterium]|nr:high-potential iron-sulfur protein [Burkholderiales bacterium]